MSDFEPDDHDDALFHTHFGGLRTSAVAAARTLADRILGRVSQVDRAPPRLSEVMTGGFAELLNVVSRLLGGRTNEDEDG